MTDRLRVLGLRKAFGAVRAVTDVSFAIAAGEVHGLCGPNGAGKSTVVKMLSGQVAPDAGSIEVDGVSVDLERPQDAQRAGIAIVDQELSVIPALTVAENLSVGGLEPVVRPWQRAQQRARARLLLDEVGLGHLDPRTPAAQLTIGERQLVEIARALGHRSQLMILDEPTATLSDVEIERVFAAVRRVAAAGCAVVFVSHRLGEVLELCDRVTVIRDGALVATTATSALNISELIEQMVGSAQVTSPARPHGLEAEAGDELVVRDLHVPGRVHGFAMQAQRGHIYALAGQLGSGASSVVRALAGLEPTATGLLTLAGRSVPLGNPTAGARAGLSFISGDRRAEGLFLGKSVGQNLVATRLRQLTRLGIVARDTEQALIVALAEKVGIRPDRVEHSIQHLSGGNQQKVLVGRALDRDDVKVLVLDEPTRGVDVAGRAVIYELLRDAAEAGLVVVFASTDLEEVIALADTVVTMWAGSVIGVHDGDVAANVVLADITHRRAEVVA